MKRKPTPNVDPAVLPEIPAEGVIVIAAEKVRRPEKCVVCGGESAPNSEEGLCWVCRRLKISAWRDTDQQATIQE